jgi:Ca-activated chloride channel family protein
MRSLIFMSLLLVGPTTAAAQGWILPGPCVPQREDRPLPPHDCISIAPAVVRTRSDVRVQLVGDGPSRVLRYEVEERYVNNGGRVAEADYLFPLPRGAAFQDLKLSINGEMVAGETLGANEARRVYEDIVRRQRDPALVEWMGHGLLRARIFPINPGEEKRVIVRFQSVAEREGDALRIDYFRGSRPGSGIATPRAVERTALAGARTSFTLTYPASSQLGTAYSPTHALDFSDDGGLRRVDVRGDASDLTLLVPVRAGREPSISVLAHAPGSEDGFALIALSPPSSRGSREEATPRDVTLVMDVSGSMAGRKIEQARAAGRQLLRTLGPNDRFRLIDFSTDVRTFRDEFVYATSANIRAAERYVDALDAQGSTNISGALAEALRPARRDRRFSEEDERLSLVLFVTDGEPTVGVRDPAQIAESAGRDRGRTRVFTFGVGSDVNVTLLERLALEARGTAQFVRPEESVERAVGLVASRLVDPVLTDVRVRVDGDVRVSRMLPMQPIDLFAGQDLVLLARYSGSGRGRVVFEGRRRGEMVRWTSNAEFPDRDRSNPFVARLWATQRVGYLSAEKRKNGGNREIDDEIRQLGERYGIPTEFTSYLVVEPNMVADRVDLRRRQLGTVGAPSAAPAPAAAREKNFEEAKMAQLQRAATSLAAVDSSAIVMRDRSADGSAVRSIGGRTFVQRNGTWTDARYRAGDNAIKLVRIKAFSKAYFDLSEQLPELRAIFALGDKVLVMGKAVAIEVTPEGADELSSGEMSRLVRDW